ncbi:hypothetical protein MTO96_007935 [Rhipicephalus appendiculatus]
MTLRTLPLLEKEISGHSACESAFLTPESETETRFPPNVRSAVWAARAPFLATTEQTSLFPAPVLGGGVCFEAVWSSGDIVSPTPAQPCGPTVIADIESPSALSIETRLRCPSRGFPIRIFPGDGVQTLPPSS